MKSQEFNREKVITSMCYTWSHDYGLMDKSNREYLWNSMAQVFDNDILPLLKDENVEESTSNNIESLNYDNFR